MRRSGAPSVKSKNQPLTVKREIVNSSNSREPNNHKENISSSPSASDRKIYNIVWSKRNMRKHKTWEGDGTLEVRDKVCIIKDEDGTFLGSEIFKPEQIFEGCQLVFGNRELEIQDKITDLKKFYSERKLQSSCAQDCAQEEKKRKVDHSVFKPNLKPNLCLSNPPEGRLRDEFMKQKTNDETYSFSLPSVLIDNENNKTQYEVKVAGVLGKHLRPHQKAGVIFLYECLMGLKISNYFGTILADEMGLGKTLQCLTICHTLLKQGPFGGDRLLQRVLIVTPNSLIENWNNEINKWLGTERMYAFCVDGKQKLKTYSKQTHIPFVIVSYEMFLSNADDFEELKFDLLICDEGHRLKNRTTKAYTCLQQINIQRKILLTGTPIQNDLQEFFAIVDFVNPGVLGSYQEFKFHFENPIVKSQAPEADEDILQLGKSRADELNELTRKFILRRTESVNRQYLPKKEEFIVLVRPSELQQLLLAKVMELWQTKRDSSLHELTPLQIITILKKICNHPSLLTRTRHDNILTRYLIKLLPDWTEMGPFDSGKVEIVQNCLLDIIDKQEKLVIVSNHTKTLDMLQGLCDHLEVTYSRLDGTTPSGDRIKIVEKFNKDNSGISVFLLSAKAGGVGLNLTGASNLILFDNDWNPATDLQAMSRIWRDGQKADVRIYRLITNGTIEEKIFQRQIAKVSLGSSVMNQSADKNCMKFSEEELKDLFTTQDNFDNCVTHASLECTKCANNNSNIPAESLKGPQMNELNNWEHHSIPIDNDFLKKCHLQTSEENIIFIFSNQTEETT